MEVTRTDTPKYTLKDYLETTKPYEELYAEKGNDFQHDRKLVAMAAEAKNAGFISFRKVYGSYCKSRSRPTARIFSSNPTVFTGQTMELDAGEWDADDSGVHKPGQMGAELVACCHPIMPVERLTNIDTGAEKLRIWYTKGRRPREIIVEKSVLASPQKILQLADMGIAVNSENAKMLISWLHDAENLNYDAIPERKSISRLGYIPEEGFSPYVAGLIFDGDANFRSIFESIKSAGKREKWLEVALAIRKTNIMARIVLAASFASALVSPCGSLPFFVHLWGGESGTGKTVAMMLAASVWGNPEMGRYIQSFNSTKVGQEKLAAFLNHLPLFLDELQIERGARGNRTGTFDVYQLAEGVGRTRGTKTGGIDKTPTWANCIITTGESPITGAGSAAGAINRVIEIECKASDKIVADGHGVAAAVKKNYGFAGREFIERLYAEGGVETAQGYYKGAFKLLTESDTTDKQAMAAAVIIVADYLAEQWIFKDGVRLTAEEISGFLASKASVSTGDRGYRYMVDWVAQNSNRFENEQYASDERKNSGDIYGVIDKDYAFIIASVFRKAAEDAGYSSAALLSYLKENRLIQTRAKNNTRGRRINGINVECVVLLINDDNGGVDLCEPL